MSQNYPVWFAKESHSANVRTDELGLPANTRLDIESRAHSAVGRMLNSTGVCGGEPPNGPACRAPLFRARNAMDQSNSGNGSWLRGRFRPRKMAALRAATGVICEGLESRTLMSASLVRSFAEHDIEEIVSSSASGSTTIESAAGSVRQISKVGTTSFPKLGSVAASPAAAPHGFDGISALQSRLVNGYDVEPPDEGLAVGNGYIVNAVNDAIRVYSTSGTPLTGVADLNSFFGYSPAAFVTDPSVYYDQPTQRWFVDVLTLEADASGNPAGPNHIDIAVSKTADPTAGWNI